MIKARVTQMENRQPDSMFTVVQMFNAAADQRSERNMQFMKNALLEVLLNQIAMTMPDDHGSSELSVAQLGKSISGPVMFKALVEAGKTADEAFAMVNAPKPAPVAPAPGAPASQSHHVHVARR